MARGAAPAHRRSARNPFDEKGTDCFIEGKIMKDRKGPLKGIRHWSLVAYVEFREDKTACRAFERNPAIVATTRASYSTRSIRSS